MEARAVANAVAQVVPFHCIICFDEFNLNDKPPVILPCGHTYLCEPCSKRIKTCMECRTPLFWTPPPRPVVPLTPYRNNQVSQRYRYPAPHQLSPTPSSPVKPPEPVALPVPKNVVLLAMMEAAERQTMMTASVMDISADDIEDDVSGQGDEDDAEIKRIIAGMESLSGACGTYAVREDEGLVVLHQDPQRKSHEQVRDPAESRDPFMIEKGQTVQVVDIENGVAKLARGMGYIVASETQLVKVGGPLDRSCQLEGTLDLVEERKRVLKRQLEQVERLSQGIKAEIEGVEGEDPNHPIITLPPPPTESQEEAPGSCPGTPVQTEETLEGLNLSESSPTVVTQGHDGVELTHSPATPGREPSMPQDLGSPFSIDNADITSAFPRGLASADDGLLSIYQRIEENDPPGIVEVGCSSFLFGRICASEDDDEGVRRLIGLSFDDSEDSSDVISSPRPPALPPSIRPTPSMVSTSSSQRPLSSSPHRTSSFDTIDFRTGMSCHRGVMSTRTSDPRAGSQYRSRMGMMSQHTGIGRHRGPPSRPKSPAIGATAKGGA